MAAISTIKNIGPAMEQLFTAAGITSAEDIYDMGADAAYIKLLQNGARAHFIMYYILHMGLQGRPWNDCQGGEKAKLRARFDAIKASIKPQIPVGIEDILNQIGTGARRG